jgi:predicted nucleic acid-binding protein
MKIVDSSAWLEYFADGPNTQFFAPAIEQTEDLLVPSLTLYEVFKRILQQTDEGHALQAVAVMQQSTVIELDARIALDAARISLKNRLPMAESVILATAWAHEATVWTQDEDFKDIPGVQFRKKAP